MINDTFTWTSGGCGAFFTFGWDTALMLIQIGIRGYYRRIRMYQGCTRDVRSGVKHRCRSRLPETRTNLHVCTRPQCKQTLIFRCPRWTVIAAEDHTLSNTGSVRSRSFLPVGSTSYQHLLTIPATNRRSSQQLS